MLRVFLCFLCAGCFFLLAALISYWTFPDPRAPFISCWTFPDPRASCFPSGDVWDPGRRSPWRYGRYEGGAAGRALLDALGRRGGRQHGRSKVNSPPQRDSGSCSPHGPTAALITSQKIHTFVRQREYYRDMFLIVGFQDILLQR